MFRIHYTFIQAFSLKGESMQEELDQMPDYNRMVQASQEESTVRSIIDDEDNVMIRSAESGDEEGRTKNNSSSNGRNIE